MLITPYSPDWWEKRRGKITASSRLFTVLYGTVNAKNQMLDDMQAELAPDFKWGPETKAPALDWGKKYEPKARSMLALMHNISPVEPGFVFHPEVSILAATPDYGFTGPMARLVTGEIKSPYKPENHLKLFVQGVRSNPKYYCQVLGQILVTGASCGWFSTYDPRAPAHMRLSREVIQPDREFEDQALEACRKISDMLQSGSRFGSGKTTTVSGIPKYF